MVLYLKVAYTYVTLVTLYVNYNTRLLGGAGESVKQTH